MNIVMAANKFLKKVYNFSKITTSKLSEMFFHKLFILRYAKLKNADTIFTHLTNAEKRKLFTLARSLKSGYVVEIGSYVGASSCFLVAGLGSSTHTHTHTAKLICIDSWENDAMSEGKRDTKSEFIENTKEFKDSIIMIQGYSANVVSSVKDITSLINLLFIDGDHSYKGCKADWDSYMPFLQSGSIVVFHDYGWAEGVQKVIEENAKPVMSCYGSLPNMFWGYIK